MIKSQDTGLFVEPEALTHTVLDNSEHNPR